MSFTSDLKKLIKEVEMIKEKVIPDGEDAITIKIRNMTSEERQQRIAELVCKRENISLDAYENLSEDERIKLHQRILKELKANTQITP